MAILFDFDNIAVACIMAQCKSVAAKIDQDYNRAWILNSLRYHRKLFSKHTRAFLCADTSPSWRKGVFEHYKANRSSPGDNMWDIVFRVRRTILEEAKAFLPYPVVEYRGAEADDIIAVLTEQFVKMGEQVAIVSSDHDLAQLQKYPGVVQYSPRQKTAIKPATETVHKYIKRKIIKGCSGDGIPNILSDPDTFVDDSKRQTPMRKDKLELLTEGDPKNYDEKTKQRFYQNQVLVDFDFIPQEIRDGIMASYTERKFTAGRKDKLLDYFIAHRLPMLIDCIEDF